MLRFESKSVYESIFKQFLLKIDINLMKINKINVIDIFVNRPKYIIYLLFY